jgi:hypothetical protein
LDQVLERKGLRMTTGPKDKHARTIADTIRFRSLAYSLTGSLP